MAGQLRGGGHAGRVAAADLRGAGAHQAGHADEEELVQIRTDDGQELHPLQQRHVVGQPFPQHAVVELQPAQLAVDEQFRRFQVVLAHVTFCDSGSPLLPGEGKGEGEASGDSAFRSDLGETPPHPGPLPEERRTCPIRLLAVL